MPNQQKTVTRIPRDDVIIRRDRMAHLQKKDHTLAELKKIKDELLTLARRVDKTIEEVEAA